MRALRLLAPFLFACGPALTVYGVNSAQLPFGEIVTVFGAIILVSSVVTAVAYLLLRQSYIAYPAAALALLILFSCGSLVQALDVVGSWLAIIVLLACGGVVVAFPVVMKRVPQGSLLMANAVGVLGLGLLIVPGLTMASTAMAANGGPAIAGVRLPAPSATITARPDIYWIILDGYARADVLAERYGLDNTPFLNGLSARGFRVLPKSQANYWQTQLSVSASLNSTYLSEAVLGVKSDSPFHGPLQRLMADSAVADYARRQGYKFVTFSTGYLDRELEGADYYFGGPPSPTPFASAVLNLGPLAAFPDLQYRWHRERVNYAFQHLADVAAIAQPKLVFAHILAPHHPFAFDSQGNPVPAKRAFSYSDDLYYAEHPLQESEYVEGYRGQLQYVNAAITRTVDEILARSAQPPIIILQGDHGPGLEWNKPQPSDYKERISILNAWYAPDLRNDLYDTMSPINTFRVIANHYFGAGLPLLPDESYASTGIQPYQFTPVPPQ